MLVGLQAQFKIKARYRVGRS